MSDHRARLRRANASHLVLQQYIPSAYHNDDRDNERAHVNKLLRCCDDADSAS